jgi:ribosomal protein S27E
MKIKQVKCPACKAITTFRARLEIFDAEEDERNRLALICQVCSSTIKFSTGMSK